MLSTVTENRRIAGCSKLIVLIQLCTQHQHSATGISQNCRVGVWSGFNYHLDLEMEWSSKRCGSRRPTFLWITILCSSHFPPFDIRYTNVWNELPWKITPYIEQISFVCSIGALGMGRLVAQYTDRFYKAQHGGAKRSRAWKARNEGCKLTEQHWRTSWLFTFL